MLQWLGVFQSRQEGKQSPGRDRGEVGTGGDLSESCVLIPVVILFVRAWNIQSGKGLQELPHSPSPLLLLHWQGAGWALCWPEGFPAAHPILQPVLGVLWSKPASYRVVGFPSSEENINLFKPAFCGNRAQGFSRHQGSLSSVDGSVICE